MYEIYETSLVLFDECELLSLLRFVALECSTAGRYLCRSISLHDCLVVNEQARL